MKGKLSAAIVLTLILIGAGFVTAKAGFQCYNCWSSNTTVSSISQIGGSGTGSNWRLYHSYFCKCNSCSKFFWVDELHNDNGIDPAVAPTCTEYGWNEGKKCTVCNKIHNRVYLVPTGHTAVADAAVAPTCTETGLTEGSHCSVCSVVLVEQNIVAPNGHTEVTDSAIAPTCTETGLTEGSHCSVCSEVFVAQKVVPANGHSEVIDPAVAPTCTEYGWNEGKKCTVCNKPINRDYLMPNGHTAVVDAAVAPTCTETGLTEGSHCSVCSAMLIAREAAPATGHSKVVDSAIAPTCTETGLTEGKHCSVCDVVIAARKTAHALGHDYAVVKSVSRTCEKGGYSLMRCACCGDEYKVNITERLSHRYGPWSSAGGGTHMAECVRGCGHTASTPCEPGTITISGLTLNACTVCGALSGGETLFPEGLTMAAVDGAVVRKTPGGKMPSGGELIARSTDDPFGEMGEVVRLYTLAFELAGISVPTGPLSVSLPLDGELPAFRLVCVSGPDAGKEIPFEIKVGSLVFTANLPGAYALLSEKE